MSHIRRCKYCGGLITFNELIKSINGKRKPLNLDDSPHRCYRIINFNQKISKNNSDRGYQRLITEFCRPSLSDESIILQNSVLNSEKYLKYHTKELWKIGTNFFLIIDKSILQKLKINENNLFVEQKVIETEGNIIIQFRK